MPVIRPRAFELIRNFATPVGTATISGFGTSQAAMYTVEWLVELNKPKRILSYADDINVAAHGAPGNDLLAVAGMKLQTITDDPAKLKNIVRASDAGQFESL